MTRQADNGHGEEMIDLLHKQHLFAVDTSFQPAKEETVVGPKGKGCATPRTSRRTKSADRGNWIICVFQIDGNRRSRM